MFGNTWSWPIMIRRRLYEPQLRESWLHETLALRLGNECLCAGGTDLKG